MTLRIALYDLDNTLYPYSSGLMEAINERICRFVEDKLQLDRASAQALRRSYFERYGTTLAGLQQQHKHIQTEEYLTFVHDIALDSIIPDDGRLHTALLDLALQKVIFTNSPHEHASRVLSHLGIAMHFSHLLDIRAFDFQAKPHQRAYEIALRTLGVQGSECVLFEDTLINLAPAKALGMTTVLIHPDPALRHQHADWVFTDIVSATQHIQQIIKGYGAKPPLTSSTAPLT